MSNTSYRIMSRVQHFFKAKPKGGYGIHSPYIFDFVTHVFYEKRPYYCFRQIEKLRGNLLRDGSKIDVTDYGSKNSRERRIRNIAFQSCKSKQDAQILFRTAVWLKAENILELGTCLGITTSYLAKTNSHAKVVSTEGCPQTAAIAKSNFKYLNINNVELIEGDLAETIKKALSEFENIDLVFIDANHKKDSTIEYFKCIEDKLSKEAIVVIDDIHLSQDMNQAWQYIRTHSKAKADIDIYSMGFLIYHPEIQVGSYKIKR